MHTLEHLPLPKDIPAQIEVWQLKLDLQRPIRNSDLVLLSEPERAGALRFYAHADQVRSIATRTMLRKLLAEKIMVRPETLHFVINEYGKPGLQNECEIEFNVSHSGNFALIALSTVGAIGVDIECYDRRIDVKSLSESVFTLTERKNHLETIEEFIQQWVAKESSLKALGVGITCHLQSISILLDANRRYRIIHDNPEWDSLKVWSIPAPEGYASALAVNFAC